MVQGNTINGTAGLGILVDNAKRIHNCDQCSTPQLAGNQTWMNSSGSLLTVSARVNMNNKNLTINGTGNTTMSGIIINNGNVHQKRAGRDVLTLLETTNSFLDGESVEPFRGPARSSVDGQLEGNNATSANGELGNKRPPPSGHSR